MPDLHSRIVKDQLFIYSINTENVCLATNAQGCIPINFKKVNELLVKNETVSDLCLGAPYIVENHTVFKNIKSIEDESLNCQIESPWANISRKVTYEEDKVLVDQKIEVKKRWISSAELESREYKKLKAAINKNFNSAIAIRLKN